MSKGTIYLAGPISGCMYEECTSWRDYAKLYLARYEIEGLDPMRAKPFLKGLRLEKGLPQYDKHATSTNKAITGRDRNDCTVRADYILVNFVEATQVSIGTVMEIAWADYVRTPIILAMQSDGSNPNEHGMIREVATFQVPTLEEALEVAVSCLS